VLVFGISHLAIVRTFWVLEKVNELNEGQTFAGKKVRTKSLLPMGAKEMGRVTCERERGGWQQRTKFGKQIRFTGVGARHQMPHAYVGAFIYVCIYKHTDMYLLFGSACWFLAFRTLRLCVRFGFWKKLMN